MRDFAMIHQSFWTGETGRRLRQAGPDVLLVSLYLMSSPASNMIGLYYLPLVTLAHECGMTPEGASKALRRASEGGFAHYDEASEIVWVPEMARYQIADRLKPGDNRIKAIERQVLQHRKSPFFNDFLAKYGEAFCLSIQAPSKALPSPFEGPSKPLRSQDQDQEKMGAATPSAPLCPQAPLVGCADALSDPGDQDDPPEPSDGTEAPLPISNPKTTETDQASLRASQPENSVRRSHKTTRSNVRQYHKSKQAPLALVEPPGEMLLPDWLPREAWQRWEQARREQRHPLTPLAARMCIKELDRLRTEGHDPAAVIDHSIAGNYRGLFAPRQVGRSAPRKPPPQPTGGPFAVSEEECKQLLEDAIHGRL